MTKKEFIATHGGSPVPVNPNPSPFGPQEFLLPTGAGYVDGSAGGGMIQFRDPPCDWLGLLRAQRQYLVAALNFESTEMARLKRDCDRQDSYALMYPGSCGPSSPHALEQLAQMKANITRWNVRLAEINELIAADPEEQRKADAQERAAQVGHDRRRDIEQRMAERNSIFV